MTDLSMVLFKNKYPLFRIKQIVTDIYCSLENSELTDLANMVESTLCFIDENIYSNIMRNIRSEYSFDQEIYVIILSLIEKTGIENARGITENIMSNTQ